MLSTGLKYGPIGIDYCMSTMTMAASSSLTIFVKISIIMQLSVGLSFIVIKMFLLYVSLWTDNV